ncbi:hypothetical protein WN943_005839 [Citrus x changshan-huyou]
MRKQMGKLLNSKDFDDGQKIGSGKTLRRWGSPCNGRRSFHKLADLDDRLKLQEQVTVSPVVLKAVLHFTESPSLRSNEDVPSSEYIVTVAATDARIFQEPVDDVGSTVNGLEMQALFRIGRGELPPVPNSLSRDAWDFILKCLHVNPNDRPTAAQLMEHPFVKRPLQTSSRFDFLSGFNIMDILNYEGNEQVPLDVLIQLLPVDNWTNLERFTLDLATLLFILVCFEVNQHDDKVVVSFGSISIRNNSLGILGS